VAACAWLRFREETSDRSTVTVDLAEEGARFSSLSPVRVGAPLLLHIQCDTSGAALECKGKVIWSRLNANGLYHFGVRFVDLCAEERQRLSRAVCRDSQSMAV